MSDSSKLISLIESLPFSFYSLISLALCYNKNIILSEGGTMQDFIAQFGSFAPIVFLILASILPNHFSRDQSNKITDKIFFK